MEFFGFPSHDISSVIFILSVIHFILHSVLEIGVHGRQTKQSNASKKTKSKNKTKHKTFRITANKTYHFVRYIRVCVWKFCVISENSQNPEANANKI